MRECIEKRQVDKRSGEEEEKRGEGRKGKSLISGAPAAAQLAP